MKKNIFSRCYSLNNNNKIALNKIFSLGSSHDLAIENENYSYPGFNISFNTLNDPISIWHLAPFNKAKYKKIDSKSSTMIQSFWVPKIDNIDPIVVIDNKELGVLGEQEAKFIIYANHQILFEKTIKFTEEVYKFRISEMFDKKIQDDYIFLCEFNFNNFGYINVHYSINEKIHDQVHAHLTLWNMSNNKLTPRSIQSRGSARKFFHISKKSSNLTHYLLVHLHKIENQKYANFKVRTISDTGLEYIKNYKVDVVDPIFVINVEDDFSHFCENLNKVGVVQLESSYDNYEGSMLSYDSENSNIAVDHLTGG